MLIQKFLTVGPDDWPKFVKDLRPTLLPITTQTSNYPLETKTQELTKINTSLMIPTQINQRKNTNTPTKSMFYLKQKNTPKQQPLKKNFLGK